MFVQSCATVLLHSLEPRTQTCSLVSTASAAPLSVLCPPVNSSLFISCHFLNSICCVVHVDQPSRGGRVGGTHLLDQQREHEKMIQQLILSAAGSQLLQTGNDISTSSSSQGLKLCLNTWF